MEIYLYFESSVLFYILLTSGCITLILMIITTIYDIVTEYKSRKFKDDVLSELEFYENNCLEGHPDAYKEGFKQCVKLVKKIEGDYDDVSKK